MSNPAWTVRALSIDELQAEPAIAAEVRATQGVLWSVESLAATEAEAGNQLWLAVAESTDPSRPGLVGGLLVERIRALGGLGQIHHPHAASLRSYWVDPARPKEYSRVLGDLVTGIRRRVRQRMPAVVWRQVGMTDALPGLKLKEQQTLAVGVVDLVGESPEDWLLTLKKSRRGDLRRLRRRLSEDPRLDVAQGPVLEVAKGIEVAPLMESNFSRHNPRRHPLMNRPASAGWIDALADEPDLRAVGYRDDGSLSAVGLISIHGDTACWLSWGVDYAAQADRRGLYYDAARRVVEEAYAAGCRRLVLGKGMADLKQSFGAHLVGQRASLRATLAMP